MTEQRISTRTAGGGLSRAVDGHGGAVVAALVVEVLDVNVVGAAILVASPSVGALHPEAVETVVYDVRNHDTSEHFEWRRSRGAHHLDLPDPPVVAAGLVKVAVMVVVFDHFTIIGGGSVVSVVADGHVGFLRRSKRSILGSVPKAVGSARARLQRGLMICTERYEGSDAARKL